METISNIIIHELDPNKGKILVYEPLSGYFDRAYFLYGAKKNALRGGHAHKELTQIFTCVYGAIEVILDDGVTIKSIVLNNPNQRIVVDAMTWRTIRWLKDDSILFVLASYSYDESDYIRNYDEFIEMVKK
jgi:dTDP-4-dehydrorhamnose 3,5-epimerase-like enzyme